MNIENRCKKIKIVLTDVDGVLTDGGMYYTKDGDIMKRFHVRDGMGVTLLRKNKISTIIVTKETKPMVRKWAKTMNVAKLYDGIKQKELMIDTICSEYKVKKALENCADQKFSVAPTRSKDFDLRADSAKSGVYAILGERVSRSQQKINI